MPFFNQRRLMMKIGNSRLNIANMMGRHAFVLTKHVHRKALFDSGIVKEISSLNYFLIGSKQSIIA